MQQTLFEKRSPGLSFRPKMGSKRETNVDQTSPKMRQQSTIKVKWKRLKNFLTQHHLDFKLTKVVVSDYMEIL